MSVTRFRDLGQPKSLESSLFRSDSAVGVLKYYEYFLSSESAWSWAGRELPVAVPRHSPMRMPRR